MKQASPNLKRVHSVLAEIGSGVGLFLVFGLLLVAPASATYEQVDIFAEVGSGSKLNAANSMAVNTTGAGGVPVGTVYSVSSNASLGVVRHDAKGEFLGAWGEFSATGIAVDQTTGYVYVLKGVFKLGVHHFNVTVYNADGSQLIASFGEGDGKDTIDESPEKLHYPDVLVTGGLAVNGSGVVYIIDRDKTKKARIMIFEPQSPGDYEHYVYAGRPRDIPLDNFGSNLLNLDSAGNLYFVDEENTIYEVADESATPTCKFQRPSGGIEAMTVDPESSEIFYFTYKTNKIHQLSPCNSEGEFVETTSFTPSPKAEMIWALAFNPVLAWEASRPNGLLYGASRSGLGSSGLGYIFAPPEIHPPSVESQSVTAVTATTAALSAQVNPKGSVTRYVFQYITDAAYQQNEPAERFASAAKAPIGGAVLGTGQAPLGAGITLIGLQSDTEYHYRTIVTSHCNPEDEDEVCEDVGPDQAFRTFPPEALELPDNRAWELVSPVQKYGGQVIPAEPQISSCKSECKPTAFGGADGFPMQSAPDGEAVVYEGFPFSTTEGAAQFNEYISRRTASGWRTTILSPPLHSSTGTYKAFDAELTEGLLSQGGPTLSPEAPPGYGNLYTQPTATPSVLTPLLMAEPPNRNPALTYAGASADLSRIFFEANDALTGETPFAPEAVDGGAGKDNLYEWANGEFRLVNVLPGNIETTPGAAFGTKEDGYFKANLSHAISDDGSRAFWSDEAGQVYVRENGESTTAIPDPGKFLTVSADGSKVLLLNGHLYDLETEETTDLTEGQGGFEGIAGQSEDLSRIYFVATAVLTGEEENAQGAKAQNGKYNLYVFDEGVLSFVATLLPQDSVESVRPRGTWIASPSQRSAQASPDGRWLAFISQAPLTGYDAGLCPDFSGGVPIKIPCTEVFLYDSASGELICPSCNRSGAQPLNESVLRQIFQAEGSLPQPRYLLDSGRLYFDSNGGVEDVYQYEPQGVGSCKREGGCVSLISAGREPIDSNFLAVDETGKNVFFTTRDRLVPQDPDDLIDLYVAREGGGFPVETETECQGEACQPAAIAPDDSTPASASFEGPGNLTQRPNGRCAKGKVRKRGRCVKKRHSKRSHGRATKRNRGGAR